MTAPLPHIQFFEKALEVNNLLSHAEQVFKEEISDISDASSSDSDADLEEEKKKKKGRNGIVDLTSRNSVSIQEQKPERKKMYNLGASSEEREWLKEILLSSDSDLSEDEKITEQDLKEMLKLHYLKNKVHKEFQKRSDEVQDEYQYYGSSFVLERNKYADIQKKKGKDHHHKVFKKKVTSEASSLKKKRLQQIDEKRRRLLEEKLQKKKIQRQKEIENKRKKLWILIARKEVPKACKQRNSSRGNDLQSLKKISQNCQKEVRKEALRSQKISKETMPRARRIVKEMMLYWKKFDKVEKEHRKKVEKEALEQRRLDEEMREMRRQQRKLNFLITQTELYAHFMGRKMKAPVEARKTQEEILKKLDEVAPRYNSRTVQGGVVVDMESQDDYDPDTMKAQALLNAQNAVMMQEEKTKTFDDAVEGRKGLSQQSFDKDFSLANPTLSSGKELPQPTIFSGKLKTYQLKGMNWLGNLYEQGINGILADEMGLGKTVQSIAFFAYLAEVHDIWGPFLVVAPASTLHNWQQEVTRFVPNFKVLPYWGNPNDRKTLRKFWNQKETFLSTRENAPFNVLITSYQLVVQDVRYFQRIRWQYLVLDEAQAIKSSSSVRWKILLGFNCRNRLLLTGTPIQNTMAELWALLHFIMPTLFDSHEEFNEWFSKDIEAQAENKANLDENQLSRLHMILKPFMLRRVKKDVENELSDKIEIKLVCHLSTRQRLLYQAIKNKISIEDLVTSTTSSSATATNQTTNTLMNLVMQFRKVCNHPEIFERRDVRSPLNFRLPPYQLPKLIYHEGYISRSNPSRNRCLQNVFSVWTGEYIFRSLFGGEKDHSGCFSVTRFLNMSCSEVQRLFESLVFRLLAIALIHDEATKVRHSRLWHEGDNARLRRLSKNDLLLWPDLPTSCTCQENSPVLQGLIFTKQTSIFASHLSHKISRIPELVEMRQTQLREKRLSRKPHSKSSPSKSPHHSPLKSPFKSPTAESSFNWVNPYFLEPEHREMVTTSYPSFLMALEHKVTALPHGIYTSDRDAAYKSYEIQFGSHELRQVLSHGALHLLSPKERKAMLFPPSLMGLEATRPERHGWSRIQIPDRNALITDSGKLNVLNELLIKLKASGHRVLIYSQMTKMIAILEEFMSFKKYKYMRLDGSSKISDRRDMVQDFQTKSDIFVFLLSTRAGGLGINLTAADTVIFYDSDWNPTVDQQAMDRAHRLGQTKQVTVYRLVTKGTIEERILQRAKEKSEIQKIVISGGQFRPDALKPKEVVSLLLDDDEMESKFLQRQAERQATEVQTKKGGRKRKNPATDNNRESPKAAEKKRKWKTTAFSDDSNTGSEFFNIKTDQFDGDVSFEGDDISVGSTNDAMSLSLNEDSNLSFGTPQSSRLPLSLPVTPDPDSPTQDSPQNQKNGRNRVRLRGTGRGAAIRGKLGTGGKGRGSKSKGGTLAAAAAAAAAAAGAAAASAAAYAAYGFSFQATGKSASNSAGPASNTGD